MSPSRRDFIKHASAASIVIASSDLVAELLAQSPKGNPLTSTFKGLADAALAEAKRFGCSYADIRFTRSVSSGVNASGGPDREAAASAEADAAAVEGAGGATAGRPALASASFTAASGASPAVPSSANPKSS